jgi:hypothetical protein
MNIYGIKDSANLTVKYKAGEKKGKVFLYSDYATVSTNDWTSEQVYAKSKNVNAIRWDYNRQSTLKVDMEIFDLKWISMVFGSEFGNGDNTDILKREVLTVKDGKATITGTLATTSMLEVYELDNDGISHSDELTVTTGTTLSAGQYKIETKSVSGVNTSEITVDTTEFPDNSKLVVFYLTNKVGAKTLTISADKFPQNYEIYADTLIRDTDGVDEFVNIHYLNVKPKSQFTLTMDANNITTLSVEFDVLKDSGSEDMATYTIYNG